MEKSNFAVIEIKPFVPARDFARSMKFYQALGFIRASVFEDIAYFHYGESSFLLQDFYLRQHAENFVIHLLVENVDDWYDRAKTIADQFNVKIGEPEDRPWAMRDFTLADPSGVTWRIAQNMPRQHAA
jgi:uncharacterized glyoxalase superfamily protein PhnB